MSDTIIKAQDRGSALFGRPRSTEEVHRLRTWPLARYASSMAQHRADEYQEVERAIFDLNKELSSPVDSFGLELRTQYRIEQLGHKTGRKTFFRLAQEPLVLSNLARLMNPAEILENGLDFVSLLCGRQIKWRDGSMWARGPKGHFVYFETIRQASGCRDDILEYLSSGLPAIVMAALCHHRVIAAHPYSDGNGRFSRAILVGTLARHGLVNAPCLPLGPVFKLRNDHLARAVIKLSQDADFSVYMKVFTSLIIETISFAKADKGKS